MCLNSKDGMDALTMPEGSRLMPFLLLNVLNLFLMIGTTHLSIELSIKLQKVLNFVFF